MRRALLTAALLLSGQAMATPSTLLSVDVKVIQTGSQDRTWKTDYGSYRDEWYQQRTLVIKSSAIGAAPIRCLLQWFFIGVNPSSGKSALVSFGQKEIALARGIANEVRVSSDIMAGTDIRFAALDIREQTGVKPSGWVIRYLTLDGKLLHSEASNPERIKWLEAEMKKARDRADES